MDHGDRRNAAHSLAEGVFGNIAGGSARLDTQQRGHRLEVVLHSVVNLANRRVLGDHLSLTQSHLGHITGQDDRTETLPRLLQWHSAQRHGHALGL